MKINKMPPKKGRIYLSDLKDSVREHRIRVARKEFHGILICIEINNMTIEEVREKYWSKIFGNHNNLVSVPIE